MSLTVERVDVWAASIKDQPGSLSHILAGLCEAGADLDFIVARRTEEKSDRGVVFVTPLRGDREIAAAAELGFNVTSSLHSVCIEGDNKPGIAAALTEKLAKAKVNIRGVSAAVIGPKFILYIGLDSDKDAENAIKILRQA
jgi:hypothetical protein